MGAALGRVVDGHLSAVSAMLTLRTYWPGGSPVGEVEVRLGERVYAVVDGRVTAGPGKAPVTVVTIDREGLVGRTR